MQDLGPVEAYIPLLTLLTLLALLYFFLEEVDFYYSYHPTGPLPFCS